MAQSVTLIFDIGKTNKKLFLFDENLDEVYNEVARFDEIPDDEDFLSEDLTSLTNWIKESTDRILGNPRYDVRAINFSTYAASMVHLDENGNVIAPFYNYLKPFPEILKKKFFEKYNSEDNFSLTTGSPYMGFLNSGMQLYFLKYMKPEIYGRLHLSLHFPQYLSYLFTGKFKSEFTCLGCHTGLWDFKNKKYAHWVMEEGFEKYLAPILPTSTVFQTSIKGKPITVGIGVHDSSSALIPYLQNSTEPFALISTGTWSVCMNHLNELELTKVELEKGCLNFLSVNGQSIKTSRLFLGKEIAAQVERLGEYFNCEPYRYKSVSYDSEFISLATEKTNLQFKYIYLGPARFGFEEPETTNFNQFENFDAAYHQLMYELTEIQIVSLKLAIGGSAITNIYIDGGFAQNELYVQMLVNKLPEYNIILKDLANGSALGAALLVNSNAPF